MRHGSFAGKLTNPLRSACKMAGHKRSRRFLEGIRNSFSLRALEGVARVLRRWMCSSLTGKTWLWGMVINGVFVCGDHKTACFKILKGDRKESSREQMLAFRRALRFCSKTRAGAAGSGCEGKGGQEEKQTHQEVSVCRGMKPAPTCLTLLILHELLEETKRT